MIEVTPDYYKKIKCIADKCKHNCCIGWEIDIDEDTNNMYSSLSTNLGQRIRENVEGNPPHFVLTMGDRCPFLSENNLCDIMSELGHDGLCEICRLHPRFRNFYDSFHETGLGLCCEEAARIILSEKDKVSVYFPDCITFTEEEKSFFKERQEIFNILQDRNLTVFQRFEKLAEKYEIKFNFDCVKISEMYLSLERLDENWTHELEHLKEVSFDCSIFSDPRYSIPFEQLSVYFIFRHLSDALYYGDYAERVRFCLYGCFVIGALWQYYERGLDFCKMVDIVRMYSSEVEYSEDNIEILLSSEV